MSLLLVVGGVRVGDGVGASVGGGGGGGGVGGGGRRGGIVSCFASVIFVAVNLLLLSLLLLWLFLLLLLLLLLLRWTADSVKRQMPGSKKCYTPKNADLAWQSYWPHPPFPKSIAQGGKVGDRCQCELRPPPGVPEKSLGVCGMLVDSGKHVEK